LLPLPPTSTLFPYTTLFRSFSLPSGLTNLIFLDVSVNALTNCSLPVGLAQLENLVIESTSLTNLILPAGMTGLTELDLVGNRLRSEEHTSELQSLRHLVCRL